jgi:hypothetical protein
MRSPAPSRRTGPVRCRPGCWRPGKRHCPTGDQRGHVGRGLVRGERPGQEILVRRDGGPGAAGRSLEQDLGLVAGRVGGLAVGAGPGVGAPVQGGVEHGGVRRQRHGRGAVVERNRVAVGVIEDHVVTVVVQRLADARGRGADLAVGAVGDAGRAAHVGVAAQHDRAVGVDPEALGEGVGYRGAGFSGGHGDAGENQERDCRQKSGETVHHSRRLGTRRCQGRKSEVRNGCKPGAVR